ncbi:SCO family protein [Pukyongiella litopenaei]|uniref:SCO family protein n=1 Tax=Pukyongiella litopenaei TaxID=2605946 RepID=A0A2S0MVW4_9RHOB|nr:SCO family protein [Pukyongiella litopenaei]AVO39823.1 SCO family protein [Pukyongiella litopenaei]
MNRTYAIAAAAAVAALLGGLYLSSLRSGGDDRFADCRTAQVAGGSNQIGGPFELVNDRGETVTDADVITGPTLIYFGYTFCPDVCPLDTARNAEAVDILESRGKTVTPVFISIDPRRDTPEVVGEFAANLHDRMIGLTGSPEQVKAASTAYKTYYKAHEAEDEFYLVDHSTFTYLVAPGEGLLEFFRRDVGAEEMADTVGCFVDKL